MSEQKDVAAGQKPLVAAAKPVRLQSFAYLIREAYGPKRKRLLVTKSDLEAIQSAPKPELARREELLLASASDRTLDRTRELLLLNAERLVNQPLAGQVRDFVREVLRRHPAFHASSLTGFVDNLPDAIDEDAAVETLASQSFASLGWPEGLPPLKKNEAERGRQNAVCCLLLWIRETRGLSIERMQRHLYTAVWVLAARRQKTDAQALRALTQTRDQVTLGIVYSTLEKRVREKNQEVLAARDSEERAARHEKQLRTDLEESNSHLETKTAQAKNLSEQLANAKQKHEDEKAHMRNDYEDLRGRVLRRLRQEVSLLDEGLRALKREPPKVHVMEDHAERAIQGLKDEIERIKGEGV